jgi:putative NIF3 family GTP cyclohydrolase 1 type 2
VKVSDLRDYLWSLHPNLSRETTVDQIIHGPDQEIAKVAVCWMPFSETIVEAHRRGANVIVAHEPTFYDHREIDNKTGENYKEAARTKKQLLDETGITILRCHDVWDAVPGKGVPDCWGAFLGLSDLVASTTYLRVYQIPPTQAHQLVKNFALKTKAKGQSTWGFYGDPDRVITKVGTGTGCCSNPHELFALGAELAVSVDDIVRAWIDGEWAIDTGHPVAVVNHGVAESIAMDSLADELRSVLPGVEVTVIDQGCSYLEIKAD